MVPNFQGRIKTGRVTFGERVVCPFLFGGGCHQKEETMNQEVEEISAAEATLEPHARV